MTRTVLPVSQLGGRGEAFFVEYADLCGVIFPPWLI